LNIDRPIVMKVRKRLEFNNHISVSMMFIVHSERLTNIMTSLGL